MSGFDKYQTVEAIKAQGWTEVPDLQAFVGQAGGDFQDEPRLI